MPWQGQPLEIISSFVANKEVGQAVIRQSSEFAAVQIERSFSLVYLYLLIIMFPLESAQKYGDYVKGLLVPQL